MNAIYIKWRSNGHGASRRKCDFVKSEFLKVKKFEYTNRTEIVRFFMQYFKPSKYTVPDIRAIHGFLRHIGLSRAERHAVIFSLGYRYSLTAGNIASMDNLQINGYFKRIHRFQQTKLLEVPKEQTK